MLFIAGFVVGVCTLVIILFRGDGKITTDTVTKAMTPDSQRKDKR